MAIVLLVIVLVVFFGLIAGIVVVVAIKFQEPLKKLASDKNENKPKVEFALHYQKREPFLSAAELSFFQVLRSVLKNPTDPYGDDQALVMCKVRVADLVSVKKGLERSVSQSAFNRIKAKHVDFVLVRPVDMSVLCVIELDDSTHRQKKVQERDQLMDSIYGAVGMPIMHVPCRRGYVKEELAGMIRRAIG